MDSAELRCPGCGAVMGSTGHCRFCGSAGSFDGKAGRLVPSDLKCPRCDEHPPLQGVLQAEMRADVCFQCHGAFLGFGTLEEVLRQAESSPRPSPAAQRDAVAAGVEPVRYARCPICDGGMSRTAVSRRPLVFIDRCPSHGDWLDAGELGQLKSLARTRGADVLLDLPRPKRIPRTRADLESGAADVASPAEWIMPQVLSESRRRRGPDLFDILGAVFGDL